MSAPEKAFYALLQPALMSGTIALALFLPAQTTDWLGARVFLVVYFFCYVIVSFIIVFKIPDVLDARRKEHADAKRWDKIYVRLFTFWNILIPISAGFDVGYFHWPSFPREVLFFSVPMILVYFITATRSMLENRHFETYVRIQKERNHMVVSSGPYSVVRHPGYAAIVVFMFMIPLTLGSTFALIPAVLAAVTMVLRTAREDATLIGELPGYQEYAQKVRYRLFPGIW